MEPKVSLTRDCFKYSTDGGKTWKELGKPIELKVDDAIDSMRYATYIAATQKHILKLDGETSINYDCEKYYNMFKEQQINKAFNVLEGEDCCKYCRFHDECNGLSCGPNGPIYPRCVDLNTNEYMNYELFKKDYLGELEEEENMNKVLELYYERKLDKLKEFYSDLEKQEYNKLEVVKEFNAINEEYINKMEELRNKHNTIDKQFVVKTGYSDDDRYELSSSVSEDIHNELFKQYEVSKLEILEEKATIDAILSLSEDKDYQVEVLKNYGILDKKGMMVEE